jgi:IS1 family transposase/transposase-like protein
LYGQAGQSNLKVRKVYGQDEIRYLRCSACGSEFSERKNTALWNSKVSEAKALAVAEHLSEGCSHKATARLVRVDPSTVRRLNSRLGAHGEAYHDERVQGIQVAALEGDERHGYAANKKQQVWEAELIDPTSKFIISHVQGRRDETLIRRLLLDGASRLANRHDLVLLTDTCACTQCRCGESSYATLFPEIFGIPYQPKRQGSCGRRPKVRFRIPRTLAHVQIVMHRQGRRIVQVDIRFSHGSIKRVAQALTQLGYQQPNTSAIERFNGTARRMSAHQVRRSLAFARRPDTKHAGGCWAVTVYNWCRPQRSLRQPLPEPIGRQLHLPQSPAMAIGLARCILSVEDVLHTPTYPSRGVR